MQHRLATTREALDREQEGRLRSEHDALRLTVERERLSDALKVERLIK